MEEKPQEEYADFSHTPTENPASGMPLVPSAPVVKSVTKTTVIVALAILFVLLLILYFFLQPSLPPPASQNPKPARPAGQIKT